MKAELLMENKAKGLIVYHVILDENEEGTVVTNNVALMAECVAQDMIGNDEQASVCAFALTAMCAKLGLHEHPLAHLLPLAIEAETAND